MYCYSVVIKVIFQRFVHGTLLFNEAGSQYISNFPACPTCGFTDGGYVRSPKCKLCGSLCVAYNHEYYQCATPCWNTNGQRARTGTLLKCGATTTSKCTTCGGDGLVDENINCKHGNSSSHLYCSHDKTIQHD